MIGFIIDMLAIDEFIGVSKTIDRAKGSHALQTSFKKSKEQYKRNQAWRRK